METKSKDIIGNDNVVEVFSDIYRDMLRRAVLEDATECLKDLQVKIKEGKLSVEQIKDLIETAYADIKEVCDAVEEAFPLSLGVEIAKESKRYAK